MEFEHYVSDYINSHILLHFLTTLNTFLKHFKFFFCKFTGNFVKLTQREDNFYRNKVSFTEETVKFIGKVC